MSDRMRFVGPLERALYLKTLPAFEGLPLSELAALSQHMRERFFRKGSVLLRRGEPVGAIYVIVDGQLRASGGEFPSETLVGPEEAVGALSFLARSDAGVEAVAEIDTLTLELDSDIFLDLLEDHFGFLHHLMRNLARAMLRARMDTPDGTYFGADAALVAHPERPLDLVDRMVIIRGGTFSRSNIEVIAQMAQGAREMRFPAGTPLWGSGDRADFLYFILSGVVACRLEDGARTFRCGPRYPLGNLEAMARYPRWYDAVTETPVIALRSETEAFLDIMEDHFETAMEFVAATAAGLASVLATGGPRPLEALRDAAGAGRKLL
jgi:CRP-like cAMP-binding protein